MIVHECIEIHPKDCGGLIIVMAFRVLLILQHLFQKNLVEVVLDVHARSVKIKKYLHPDVVTIHLLHKGFMENYLCWYAHGEIFIRNESMVERMVGSTSSASNVYGVGNDNNNTYRNMVMDAMRMNQGNVTQCLIIE
jgi:hypothetical protein